MGERASALSPDRGYQDGTSLLALGCGLLGLLLILRIVLLRRVNVSSHCGYLLVRVRDEVDQQGGQDRRDGPNRCGVQPTPPGD